jgi:hypothetical protein
MSKYQHCLFYRDDYDEKLSETGIFSVDEEYSYVKDLKDAYRNHLKQSLEDQIFEQIPDHAFYDIKTPLIKDREQGGMNKYNPVRPKVSYTFFEFRHNWQYIHDLHAHPNMVNSIGKWKRY